MFKKLRLFVNWRAWGYWGLEGPDPFKPYEWRLFLGPICIAKLTDRKARRLSRQERRHLERQLAKRARSIGRLLGENWPAPRLSTPEEALKVMGDGQPLKKMREIR